MNNKKRMHPFFIIIDFLNNYKLYIVLMFIFNDKNKPNKWWIIIFVSIILISFFNSVLKYFNKTYQFKDDVLIFNEGISLKKEKHINFHNIQNVDTSANFIFQMFDLVSLDINLLGETVKLKPIKRKEANRIIGIINNSEKNNNVYNIDDKKQLFSLSFKDLIILSFMKINPIVTFFVISAFYDDVKDIISKFVNLEFFDKFFKDKIDGQGIYNIIFSLSIIILILIVISFILTFIKFYNFYIEDRNNSVVCKYGLLNKQSLVIKKERIQKISFNQNWLQKLFNLTDVKITTLSDDIMEGLGEKNNIYILPIAKKDFAEKFLKDILDLDINSYQNCNYNFIEKKGEKIMLKWLIFRLLFVFVILNVFLYYIPYKESYANLLNSYKYFLYLFFAIYLIYSVYSFKFRIKNEKTALTDNMIVRVYANSFGTNTNYIKPFKIGNIERNTNIFLKKKNIYNVKLNVIGNAGDIYINYIDEKFVDEIKNYFFNKEN